MPGTNCSQKLSTRIPLYWEKRVEVRSRDQGPLSFPLPHLLPSRLWQPLAWASRSLVVIEWSLSRDLLCQEPNGRHHSQAPLLARTPVNNAICILRGVHPEQQPLQWTNSGSGAGNSLNGSVEAAGPEEAVLKANFGVKLTDTVAAVGYSMILVLSGAVVLV